MNALKDPIQAQESDGPEQKVLDGDPIQAYS